MMMARDADHGDHVALRNGEGDWRERMLSDGSVWIDLQDASEPALAELEARFGFHRLALEDAASELQRPKVDRYDDYLVMQTLSQGMDRLAPTLVRLLVEITGVKGILARTDPKVLNNANTMQAVFRAAHTCEADVIGTEWRRQPLPTACTKVPTMLVPDELRLLNFLAQDYYRGAGAIVDAGSFLGGSTVALAEGLRRWCSSHGIDTDSTGG